MMKKEEWKSQIIRFVENSSDEDNLKIAVFIAGMQAQKKINLPDQEDGEKTRDTALEETDLMTI